MSEFTADGILYAWPARSSQGTTTYEVLLHRDGRMSCNCPGWVYGAKRASGRICRHIREREAEAEGIVQRFRAGEPIVVRPVVEPAPAEGERIQHLEL